MTNIRMSKQNPKISYAAKEATVAFSLAQEAWAKYQKFRPSYPQSILDLWFAYHRAHGGKFDSIHDVGAGRLHIVKAKDTAQVNIN